MNNAAEIVAAKSVLASSPLFNDRVLLLRTCTSLFISPKKKRIMEVRELSSIPAEEVTAYGSTNTTIQWLSTVKDESAPHFAMRRFVIKKGGNIGIHDHWNEHGIFILSGSGYLIKANGDRVPVKATNTVLVPPWEPHGYEAPDEDLEFLCVIPHEKFKQT